MLNVSEEREFRTQFGGLFLFLPYLAAIPFDDILARAGLPGSQMIGAGHAIRSLLGLKLFGRARHSHIISSVFDQGLALFAGLNAIPKRAFLTEYSCRVSAGLRYRFRIAADDNRRYSTYLVSWTRSGGG